MILERMQAGVKLVVEDFPLEIVADLCLSHNYRWSFCECPNGKASMQFLVEPGHYTPADPGRKPRNQD